MILGPDIEYSLNMERENLSITKKYKLIQKLGEGASSEVYKAICSDQYSDLKQTVVLKILKSKKSLSALRKELSSLTAIRSKYCVRALGWELISGRPALVLEYIESVSLFELMNTSVLTPAQAQEIYSQVYKGIQDLSKQGLFHGDLNPKNILINTSGEVFLIDYGLANTEYTTYAYATTARIKGTARPDLESDLFSLNRIYKELVGRSVLPSKTGRSDGRVCKSLGDLVKSVLLSYVDFETQIIHKAKKTPKVPFKFLLYLILGFSVTALSSVHTPRHLSYVKVELRSAHWTQVYINSQSLGFTPLKLTVRKGRAINLKFKTAYGMKERSLTPTEDGTILLK